MKALGVAMPFPPTPEASRMSEPQNLWRAAGLEAVEMREITVERRFTDLAEFWSACTTLVTVRSALANMPPSDIERLQQALRARLSTEWPILCPARANAIWGREYRLRARPLDRAEPPCQRSGPIGQQMAVARMRLSHVPKHQDAAQFPAAGNGGRDPRLGLAIRPQAQRLHAAVPGQ
jgi:hypothetical protein